MFAKISSSAFNRIISATKLFISKDSRHIICRYIRLRFDPVNKEVTAIAIDGVKMSVEHSVLAECDEKFEIYIKPFTLPANEWATFEVAKGEASLRCSGCSFGFIQPENVVPLDPDKIMPKKEPIFKIAFNGDLLADALKSAKVSAGNVFNKPLFLKFMIRWSLALSGQMIMT